MMAKKYTNTFDRPYWNLMQTLSWILLRNPDVVSEADKKNEDKRTCTKEDTLSNGEVKLIEHAAPPFNFLDISIQKAIEEDEGIEHPYKKLNDAWGALIEKCENGKIAVQALENGNGLYKLIPQIELSRLNKFIDDRQNRPYFQAENGIGYDTRWYDPLFKRKEILEFWPEDWRKQVQKAQPISLHALKSEYKKYVSECESQGLRRSWQDDLNAMTTALGKSPTHKQIKSIRAKLAPDHWKKGGRRKSN